MFTQKRGSLTRGKHANSFLIPSGERDTPSAREWCNPSSKTEVQWGAGGKLRKAPAPPGLETLKSQILSCSYMNPPGTEVHRRLCVDISIHYPVPEAGNPQRHLSHTLARPQRTELPLCPPSHHFIHQLLPLRPGPAVSTPTSAQLVPKGPRKDVSNPGAPLKQVTLLSFFFFFKCRVLWEDKCQVHFSL